MYTLSFARLRALLLLVLLGISTHAAAAEHKPWLFLTYVAGVNNLDDFIDDDLYEMARVGSNDNIHVVAYVHRYKNRQRVTQLVYVEKNQLIILDEFAEDSGDVESLKNALAWALTEFPSDHVVVDLWNHGAGIKDAHSTSMKGICFDDISGSYLTDRDCRNAFMWAQENFRDGKKFDIIACDACLMAMIECAYTFKDCADYFVASEETIPGYGYDYEYILDNFEKESLSPRACAENMVTAYKEEYGDANDYTLSAIDLAKIDTLVATINAWAEFFDYALHNYDTKKVQTYLKQSAQNALSFYDGIYVDIVTFCAALYDGIDYVPFDAEDREYLVDLLYNGVNAVYDCVIKNVTSKNYQDAAGLALYFPRGSVDAVYNNLYWTEHNPACLQMFNAYVAGQNNIIPLLPGLLF